MVPIRASSSWDKAFANRADLSASDIFGVTGAFYLCPQPQLHFTGGLFGERDRDDAVESAYALANQSDDPANQRRGFASSGCSFDEQCRAEISSEFGALPPHRPIWLSRLSWHLPELEERCEWLLRFATRSQLLVWTANRLVVAPRTLPLGRRCRQKRLIECLADDCRYLRDGISGVLIERDDEFGESTCRSAKIQTSAINFQLSAKELFSCQRIKGWLQGFSAGDDLPVLLRQPCRSCDR